ncbi:MAG: cysteine--tRNA ligase [bacterium]|nr:cysteine--tRNA ligase [bacterium]
MQPKFFNSLSRKVDDFKPIKTGEVSLYTCGPTVYDYMHIGNLRKFVFDDTLRRTLEASSYKVRHAMNITDVGHLVSDEDDGEDKLEKGAKREGKTVWEVAEHYIEAFVSDVSALNILPPNAHTGNGNYSRATDFVSEQIEMVETLIEKGYAYQTEQAIYFDVTKLPSYGELTGQSLSDKEVGARPDVVTDKNKHHPQDFGLWFFTVGRFVNHDMRWDSPWGEGFPGWHLECSAIIHAVLRDPIDIHTGGVDNIGTHHVNEMAQTEAAYGHKLANYWMHAEHLLVNEQRMGKSLGNFYTLADIKKKGYDPLALRLLYLQAHYRKQMNFSWEALDGAQAFLNRLQAWADLQFQPNLGHRKDAGALYAKATVDIQKALNDDLNTGQALAVLSRLANTAEQEGVEPKRLTTFLEQIDQLLGLGLSGRKDISDEVKSLIAAREEARMRGDWENADELRSKLLAQSIEINDTPHGPAWFRGG